LLRDTLALVQSTHLAGRQVLVRMDWAFYSHALVAAATRARGPRLGCHRADGPGGRSSAPKRVEPHAETGAPSHSTFGAALGPQEPNAAMPERVCTTARAAASETWP
jgi:hypothetical protein